jgi:transposase
VQLFKGNTSDVATFSEQVEKVQKRFGAKAVTFVGDRGMIKSEQISKLTEAGHYYITALTKAQIEKLLSTGVFQMSLFESAVAEVITEEGLRYILRRNPVRAEEIRMGREQKYASVRAKVSQLNAYLSEHAKAVPKIALAKVQNLLKKLRLSWLSVSLTERTITLVEDKDVRTEEEKLDGCYVIKSDLASSLADKHTIHSRYKDLAQVEWAFRTSKTAALELRPIYLRLEDRTRAHALIVMLAYKIIRKLSSAWAKINITVEQALNELASLCLHTISFNGVPAACHTIPQPRNDIAELLATLNITMPSVLPFSRAKKVVTKVKLQNFRKNN